MLSVEIERDYTTQEYVVAVSSTATHVWPEGAKSKFRISNETWATSTRTANSLIFQQNPEENLVPSDVGYAALYKAIELLGLEKVGRTVANTLKLKLNR